MSTDLEIAWAAGFFEGEGTFFAKARKTHPDQYQRYLALTSTDLDVLEKFNRIVGAGSILPSKRKNLPAHYKPAWVWHVYTWAEVERITLMILPYMGERRTKDAKFMMSLPTRPQGRQRKHD